MILRADQFGTRQGDAQGCVVYKSEDHRSDGEKSPVKYEGKGSRGSLWQGCATTTVVYQFASHIHAAVKGKSQPSMGVNVP